MFQRNIKCTFLFVRNVEYLYCKSYRNLWNQSPNNEPLLVQQAVSNVGEVENNLKRTIPRSHGEYKSFNYVKPSQPENPHLVRVSILGEPNVGKSTLTNSLVKWRVCAVSRKVHTTRKKARAVLIEGNTQIVFLDTPGFVAPEKTRKHSLEPSFVMDPLSSIREADLIAVVVDISDKWGNNRINPEILRTLYDFKWKRSILVLNKIDAMKSKSRLLTLTRILTANESKRMDGNDGKEVSREDILTEANQHINNVTDVDSDFYENADQKRGWPLFSKVFMVSALRNDGVEDLRNYMLNQRKPSKWLFHEGIVTDQHPHDIALTTVRENLLDYLPNEIPYKLNLKIAKWEVLASGSPKIDIKIQCANSRHRSFVIGPEGKHIAACVAKCRKAMKESFKTEVVLKVAVV